MWHTQKQTNKVVCKKAYKKFWPYFALILYFQWYHAMPFDHPLLLTKSQSWTMWVKLSVPHQHWITGIYISFKFMKIIIIHAFTVSYESFASFLNAAVNWHAFNSLMIIKSSRPKKGWTQFAKKNLVKKSVQVAIVHHSFSWSSSNKVQVLYVKPYSIQWSNK